MKINTILLSFTVAVLISGIVKAQTKGDKPYHEQYRLQAHFSPKAHWVNDPNGMVYFNHTYHLFFQYYPGGTTWGPMHWGHAISKDLMHWKELPIALYPDSLGYIFSGSAVVDSNNTSGFGKNGKIPLVAIFTSHDPKREKEHRTDVENESIAYSLDNGNTWTKYSANPVLKNPGITDFRDPKVMWFAAGKKWIMTLATKDRVTFYSSPNLKDWTRESDFGKDAGSHLGVWECPDLFSLKLKGKTYWVLIANVNPGGPNGGSATQYFVGDFDGNKFTPAETTTKWMDYGPDEYAGITWSNTGSRKIFLGWMSNWTYANQVPTEKWRNGMTLPKELALKQVNGSLYVTSTPVKEIAGITGKAKIGAISQVPDQFILTYKPVNDTDYAITLSNKAGEKLVVGYDQANKRFFIDRSKSGKTDFNPEFEKIAYAPILSASGKPDLKLVVDASSIELFADGGLTVMTAVFFSETPYHTLKLESSSTADFKNIKVLPLKAIW